MPSEATTIARALRRSPVYVAPSLASALPGPERLLAAIRSCPVPVFAVIVPLVKGGEWADSEHLADAVHARLGRKGVYIALGEDSADTIEAFEYGVDRGSIAAADAVNLDPAMDDASLTDRLLHCVGLITSGRARAEYDRRSKALDRRIGRETPRPESHDGLAYAADGGGVLVVAGALLIWRRRRMADVKRAARPRPVVTSARSVAELRERASAELVALGESLDAAEGDTGLLQGALDAYSAAGKALDAARTVPDLAGVLVLADMGRDASEAARHGRAHQHSPLCFFNPLHGDGTVAVSWRAVGERSRLKVRACAACARAVRARDTPDVLLDGTIPYYEVDPARSVWAATGYGQIRDDLVQRVLRGDLRRG